MKPYILGAVAISAFALTSTSSIQAQTVLTGGETWSALEDYQINDAVNTQINAMANTGTNGSEFGIGSGSGRFQADGSGNALTQTTNGAFTRYLPAANPGAQSGTNDRYSSPYTTGKFRLEWVIDDYDFTAHGVAEGGQDSFEIKLRSGNTDVVGLRLRIKDSGTDSQADQFQSHHRSGFADDKFSGNLNVVGDGIAANSILSLAVEFDFDNNTIFYERNGNTIAGTGLGGSAELGAFTATGFDQLVVETVGIWGTGSSFITTDSFTLSTAVPEPSSYALLGGLLALGYVMVRRR